MALRIVQKYQLFFSSSDCIMFGLIIINSTNIHRAINGIVDLIRNINRKKIQKVFHDVVQNNKLKAHVFGHKQINKKQLSFAYEEDNIGFRKKTSVKERTSVNERCQ